MGSVRQKIHLHVDIELQGKYHPGYPLEKRGFYNLSRMIGSQLDVVNAKSNYNKLEKAYCIFICVGDVPRKLWNTVSYYGIENRKNIGKLSVNKENYDLMELIVIRIGEDITDSETDLVNFLHGVFYDYNEVEKYIDFSQNEEFRRELKGMGMSIGEGLVAYGQKKERAETLKAKRLLKIEREKVEKEHKRAEAAEQERMKAEREAQRQRERAEALEAELSALKNRKE